MVFGKSFYCSAEVRVNPVKFLLNSGRELLIELLQIHKAYDQSVPLWSNQFFSITQVFDLPIAVLESESDSGKRFTVTHQAAIERNQILLNSGDKAKERITHTEECAGERRHPTVPCKHLSNNTSSAPLLHLFYQPPGTDAPGLQFVQQVCPTETYLWFNNDSAPANRVWFPQGDANSSLVCC